METEDGVEDNGGGGSWSEVLASAYLIRRYDAAAIAAVELTVAELTVVEPTAVELTVAELTVVEPMAIELSAVELLAAI